MRLIADEVGAAWEMLAREIAQALIPDAAIAALVAAWLSFLEALREFGARALLGGADSPAPTLSAAMKPCPIVRLNTRRRPHSRPMP